MPFFHKIMVTEKKIYRQMLNNFAKVKAISESKNDKP